MKAQQWKRHEAYRYTVSPSAPDRRKQSLYFPDSMLKEMADEAARQDRSLSWLIQKAWRLARDEIKRFPAATRPEGGNDGNDRSG